VAQLNIFNDTIVAFYGIDRLRFTGPVFAGDTIHVRKRVVEKQEKDTGGLVSFETKVLYATS
jgi:acyl dehydratase